MYNDKMGKQDTGSLIPERKKKQDFLDSNETEKVKWLNP